MDRLVKVEQKELMLRFTRGQRCASTFKITNLMHTMSVAISLTTTNSSLFSFPNPFSIIPPLSTLSSSLSLFLPSIDPPLSSPIDTLLVRSSMLPTGKASLDDLRRLFSKPGPHIFRDASIPIYFVGPHVVEFLLTPPPPMTLEVSFLLSRAISSCDGSELSSLLRFALKNGNSDSISSLIDFGADVNGRDEEGRSAMALAVKSGNCDSVRILLESGYAFDRSVDLFLHDAAAMNRVDLMEILCLGYEDIDMNSTDSDGRTPLHVAAAGGHVNAIRLLVSAGGDPEVSDREGWTPLHCAAAGGHGDTVDLLLSHTTYGKYGTTRDGRTPFGLAVDESHPHLYGALQLGDALHRAARTGDVHAMRSGLRKGAEVNGRDQNGWTPLHRAAFKGRMECVKVLIGHGAKIDAVDDDGCTPLHLAAEAGHLQVALYLINNGARSSPSNIKVLNLNLNLNLDEDVPNHRDFDSVKIKTLQSLVNSFSTGTELLG